MTFANGVERVVDIVIGADGVRSSVRRLITGGHGTVYSKTSAFRGIVPARSLRALPDPEALQFWMGPRAHLLHYAIGKAAEDINFFAVVEGPEVWPHDDKWIVAANQKLSEVPAPEANGTVAGGDDRQRLQEATDRLKDL